MKHLFQICLAITLLAAGCATKNDPPGVFLYRRDSGANNGVWSYLDIAYITNYKNATITIDSFVKMVKNYVDTATTEMPVEQVILMGKKSGHDLPNPNPDNLDEQIEYYLLAVGFDVDHDLKAPPRNCILRSIALWHDGEQFPFVYLDKNLTSQDKQIDSLLKLKTPFDNNF